MKAAASCDDGDCPPPCMASASARSLQRPIMSPWEEPISATRTRAPTLRIGVSKNATDYGSALSYIPEIPWNDSCAGSILAVFLGYPDWLWIERLLRKQHGATIRKPCSGCGQRRAQRMRNRRSGGESGGRRQLQGISPNLRGKQACPGFRATASGIFPTSLSSPPTVCGATIIRSVLPILPMAAGRVTVRRSTGPAGVELPLHLP